MTHAWVFLFNDEDRVGVTTPLADCLRAMSLGGIYDDRPNGFLDELVYRKTSSKLQQGRPRTEEGAWRMVRAWAFGGCTTAEAYDIVKAHDVDHVGHRISLQHWDDLPSKNYRDAWRMNHNGAVHVSMPSARRIQFARIKRAIEQHNTKRLALCRKPMRPEWVRYASAVRHARDECELGRVWPEGLAL